MVAGPVNEHGMQADVVFVIEGTAVNGAYLNDLKTNYLIPTLEYFSQGNIEDREYVSENSTTLYGVVVYHAADCLPAPCTATLGPFSNPRKLLQTLECLEMVGGKGESHANIAEGLATALLCFEDLQIRRDPSTASQKHCILVCNSPPYQTTVQESYKFAGHAVESLAALFQDNHISLSILSPRKIPALFKLFEKAGGDLQTSQTKNYAKDPRHLVLLRNYNLKERPVSPTIGGTVHPTNTSAAQIPLSPLQSHDSPNTNQVVQNLPQPQQTPNPAFRNQTPANINPHQQQVPTTLNVGQINPGRPPFNPQISAPPNYHPRGQPPRWRTPFITPGAGGVPGNTQGSALIAQLTQPPSAMTLNVPFNQRIDGNGGVMGGNPQQQQQQQQVQGQPTQGQAQLQSLQLQQQQQQQQVRQAQQQATMQAMQAQVQAQQNQAGQQNQTQQQNQLTVSSVSQTVPAQVQTVTVSQPNPSVSSVSQQVSHNPTQQQQQGNVPVQQQQQQQANRERPTIWQGILEWLEKAKNTSDNQKHTRQVPCQVSANTKDGEPELKADSWPQKLIMQLMPKQLIGSIGGAYLKNSKSVLFHPSPCEALDSLTKVLSTGFAGCVHFTSPPTASTCEIKVLILLYTVEKRAYLGFIPNDQTAFVDRLRKVIQHQKTTQALIRQSQFPQGGAGPVNNIPGSLPTTGISQGGIMMSQTNTMAMGGGQITQNVVSSTNPQQTMANTVAQGQMSMQGGGMTQQQVNPGGGGMMSQQQRGPFADDLEMARQQNLMKIHQLRQTLEAAQQQEAQYKSQLEVNIQQTLQEAQQQEMQYKQQMEAQQAQRGLNQNPGMVGQQPNTQRMMRPVMASNMGLRHLLQQQQPQQYRQQVMGMQQQQQQQMVGPRGQMAARPMAPGNQQNQQFDDVSGYDFLS